ncbi:hypothetical protein [Georgenia sp. SUBG003]|uniref:hypothetical protein n=1 Tax=Georgenia sp. SUBG003 TaxID=1497974 RepID=UPI0004D34597|nr:hypothetical protein DA06_02755 [Georgenia sp. SUBG003]
MTAVRDLTFTHRFTLHGGGPHLDHVEVESVAPLTDDGVSTFVRYRDDAAARYGYAVSRWAAEQGGAVHAEVLLYAVDGDADGSPPRHHPSEDRRLRQIAELAATAATAAATSAAPAGPGAPTVWVRPDRGGKPVPAALESSERLGGVTRVRVLGTGIVPTGATLLLARPGLAADALAGPVTAEVHACTHRDEEEVASRVRSGRGRPAARLTFGTLAQLREGPSR